MKKRTLVFAVTAVIAASTAATATAVWADESDPALGEAIDKIIDEADGLKASQVGVVVADAESGDVLYDHNGLMRAVPASNTKLLTSTAAMDILGPDYTFGTDVAAESEPSDGTIAGDLYLRGTGDPTMLAEDYDDLAEQLADAGVTTVDGDLVADDTAYDANRYGPDWEWDDLPYY
ncbi:MAG: D-alanyl-D-alanine carboxypeptidase/D-alanyl-D-alanine endopeptidase, partial [Stackebrandtia sp.]